jgi:hypothetical protein
MTPIKVLDIFDAASSNNFHPEGLFSVEIFGKVGTEYRSRIFSYIDLHIPVIHPMLFKALGDLKSLYVDILAHREFAVFDPQTQDFVKSNAIDGKSGYSFFLEHLPKLKFEKRDSPKREFNIQLLAKFIGGVTFEKMLVMPAGLRDYMIDDNGKPSEDEINTLYRKILSISNIIENVDSKANAEYLDSARYSLQLAVNEIYNYIVNLLEGKSKLILGKWAGRKIVNSTRNVITSFVPDSEELFGPRTVSTNHTVMGLYQFLRAIIPVAVNKVRDKYISKIFIGPNSPAVLVNSKTLKKESIMVDPEYYDDWMSYDGLEQAFARFGEEALRHDPLQIGNYYFGLLYVNEAARVFRFMQDIDELPEGYDKSLVRPITFAELLYISVAEGSDEFPCFVTRYPITGYGSFYPSYVYLKTTIQSKVMKELNENWEPTDFVYQEFPVLGQRFYDTMSPSKPHIGRLGADYDGDLCSGTCTWTEDAKEEVKKTLNSRNYYVGVNGRMSFSAADDIIDLVVANMTKRPETV